MDVSVVIPTCNRIESLHRCLASLASQLHPLKEVVVVDASDEQLNEHDLGERFPHLPVVVVRSCPSVCVQRNRGINIATSSHILLCDDDIELPPNYISTISTFMKDHPDVGAACGMWLEPTGNRFEAVVTHTMTMASLCWRFVFQLTIWSDVDSVRTSWPARFILRTLKTYYRRRGNTWTHAGWPLVTQIGKNDFRTTIFSLGAAVVQRDWLAMARFDEVLDPYGIGDNYGVAINFPGKCPITVLRNIEAIHHRSSTNRLQATITYFRRILALDYFMSCSMKFTIFNRIVLMWSLIGNLIPQVVHRQYELAYATVHAGFLIATGRNPYVLASRSGRAASPIP